MCNADPMGSDRDVNTRMPPPPPFRTTTSEPVPVLRRFEEGQAVPPSPASTPPPSSSFSYLPYRTSGRLRACSPSVPPPRRGPAGVSPPRGDLPSHPGEVDNRRHRAIVGPSFPRFRGDDDCRPLQKTTTSTTTTTMTTVLRGRDPGGPAAAPWRRRHRARGRRNRARRLSSSSLS